jgi:hypothetical protein
MVFMTAMGSGRARYTSHFPVVHVLMIMLPGQVTFCAFLAIVIRVVCVVSMVRMLQLLVVFVTHVLVV